MIALLTMKVHHHLWNLKVLLEFLMVQLKVLESNKYPGKSINKLECIGHIQKRVGVALIKLVKGNRGISGKGEGKIT